jgi:hypothetical protein
VDLTGSMNSRSFRRKKRLLGSRCGAKRVYPTRILLSSLSLVPMLFRFVTSLSLPVALSVSLRLGRLCSDFWVLPLINWPLFATVGGLPLLGVISLDLESRRSIAWACRLHPLGRVLCLIGSRALILLVWFMAAECTSVPTFKIQILTGIGVVIFTGVPFGLGGLLGCWARRPSAVFSVRRSVTWSFFVPQINLLSVSRWPHFLPLGAGPFWWEIEILRITLLGFALPWCPCPVDRPVSVASRSSPGRY